MLNLVNEIIWGYPALILILSVGVYIAIRNKFPQLKLFPETITHFIRQFKKRNDQSGSGYAALCTALAATVGTGNMIGVAYAIALGGPGAIFWMWVCGFLGMGIKFAEATLAVHYRTQNKSGEYIGGPMYMIEMGMGRSWKWLAIVYSAFGIFACFGVGNAAQVNAVVTGINAASDQLGFQFGYLMRWVVGFILAIVVGAVLVGGARRISNIAKLVVPIAACGYMFLCIIVLFFRIEQVTDAFKMIFYGAFDPRAVTGGVLGSAFCALRVGASKGTFTNEAGMGTASIAHAGANVSDPVDQGLMGIMEVFIDTFVICTMTALVILCSGVKIPYGIDGSASLLFESFSSVVGNWIRIPLGIALCSFAVATIFGWSLYGLRCGEYLFGRKAWTILAIIQSVMVVFGAVISTSTAWTVSEILNGLMMIPNLIALISLNSKLIVLLEERKIGMRKSHPD